MILKPLKTVSYLKLKVVGKRLILRPFLTSDLKVCQTSHTNRVENQNRFDAPLPVGTDTLRKFKSRLQKYRARAKSKLHYNFAVFEKHTGAFVGQIDILTINQEMRWGNLGYHIQNHHYGNGYAVEACQLALELAFNRIGFHRIEASMELDNTPSRRVAEKLGLDYEGQRKKFFADSGGVDLRVYATNAIDFRK